MTNAINAASADRSHRPRILVVYQYVPLYRLPVFEALAKSTKFDFTFATGVVGKGETPKLADRRQLENSPFSWIYLNNTWLPQGMLWQSGIVGLSIKSEYDLVLYFADMHYLSTWVSVISRKLLGRRSSYWTIGMHRPASGMALLIRRLWFSFPDRILLYGEYGKALLATAGVGSDRLSVIFNSLDFDGQSATYEEALRREVPPRDVPLIVSMGRVTDRRKLNRLIEAAALLRARGRDIQVRIIGNGSARPGLEALAADLGVADRVHFLGAIYDERALASHLVEADVCVVPGVIGLGVVHAHTYGCPVITCGDMAIQAPEVEVMDPGVTGLFCAWDDSESVAAQIERWLSDGRPKAAIRDACRARVEAGWTPASQRAAIEAAIQSILPVQST